MSPNLLMFVLIAAVPVTAMTQDGAGIFLRSPYARVIWSGLTILAAFGLILRVTFLGHWNPECGSPLLLALPLVQSFVFLASQWLFRRVYGRPTVMFSVAKNQRDSAGQVRWSDILYWMVFGYLGIAVSLLVAFQTGLKALT